MIPKVKVALPQRAGAIPLLAFLCALGWLSAGYSQEAHHEIPPNAHVSAGVQGWVCNNRFRQVGGLCVEDRDEVPSWGAFEVFADGQWRCLAGHHREGSFCVPATAPAHAGYVGDGSRWECDWGYQKVGSGCEEIKAPAHAYIEASGKEWVCYPGFEKRGDRCAAVGDGGEKTVAPGEGATPGGESPRGKR